MFQSFVSWVQRLSEYAIVNPWLVTVVLISIQLVLLSLMAVLLSRQISFKTAFGGASYLPRYYRSGTCLVADSWGVGRLVIAACAKY